MGKITYRLKVLRTPLILAGLLAIAAVQFNPNPATAAPVGSSSILVKTFSVLFWEMMARRCDHYTTFLSSERLECKERATDLIAHFDLDLMDGPDHQAAGAFYSQRLIKWIQLPATSEYLLATASFLRDHAGESHVVNLWEWTLRFTRDDPEQALEWIALLFQDTSDAKIHVKYLRLREGANHLREVEALDQISTQIGATRTFDLFPTVVEGANHFNLNRGLYHFYVMAYMAHQLHEHRPRSELNATIPFLINTTYEFFRNGLIPGLNEVPSDFSRLTPQMIFTGLRSVILPEDPRPFDANSTDPAIQDALHDIYLGYAGSIWGVGEAAQILPYDEFAARLGSDPHRFIRERFF